jgi:hypothetical protein
MSTTILKSQINLDCPDECDVLRAIFFETITTSPRGFLDVFTEDEVLQMWGSSNIYNWSSSNRDWLVQTVDKILSKHIDA